MLVKAIDSVDDEAADDTDADWEESDCDADGDIPEDD
jgi:hypothetical protein